MFVFTSAAEPSYGVSTYTAFSEYRLIDDGRFTLWYGSLGAAYRGTYTEADGAITFTFNGAWAANGVLRDQTLTVRYNLTAQMADFEDAVYTRKD